MPHTPGPWKALRGVDDDDTRWIVVAARGDREWHIATVENGQPGDYLETEAATARLVAAAPDMLDALHLAAEALDDYSDVNDGDDGQPVANRAMSALRDIEAAIAKAEGGQ